MAFVQDTPSGLNFLGGSSDSGLGGAGLIALLAATGALGNNRRNEESCIPAQLNTVADGINHNINTSMIGLTNQLNAGFGGQRDLDLMQKLGNIEGDIWKAEGEVQLAVAGSTASLTNAISQGTLSNLAGQAAINKNITDGTAAVLASNCGIKEAVAAYGVANLTATKDAQYAITTAVRDDGDKTRAKIDFYHDQDMQRKLTVADGIIAERNAALRGRESEINITNTNTATAQQFQVQGQQQQQLQILANLAAEIRNLAGDIQAVRQGQVVFNSGTMAGSATQAAANTKVA